jgi:hypothetical protein
MISSICNFGSLQGIALAAAAGLIVSAGSALADISQSGEQRNMRRVGHVDLQGRAAYHPDFITYPDGRVIAFVGTHSNTTDNGPRPNPLKAGSPVEPNGTMIVDITNPRRPVEKFHIPGPIANGSSQTQSNRLCLGSVLPGGVAGKVYLLRNVQTGNLTFSGYEVWDVTDVNNPALVGAMRGLRNTHKPWWECKTGIAYLPGSKGAPAAQWRQGQSMIIADWRNPASPVYLRTHGLPGAQPGATGPVPTSLHGAISSHEHPNATSRLARGATPDDIIGNRIYLAWGVGDDGVLQVLDRKKTLPPPFGTFSGDPDIPTNAALDATQTSILYTSPDQGGHTSFPVFGMAPKSYQGFTEFQKRDIVVFASESTADLCNEAPHWSFIVDVTVENSRTDSPGPPTRRALPNPWQGPMVLSTMHVDPRAGEKYPRGNYCTRGARFGVHSSEENFRNPFYGKLTFMAYFTGGVRVWDIREPHAPVEVGFYVPVSNILTEPAGYMTNNLEVDNRGYVLAVDRNGAGFDILKVTGKARRIAFPGFDGRDDDDDEEDD